MPDAHTNKWSSKRVRAMERWGNTHSVTVVDFALAGKAGPQKVAVKFSDTQPDRRQTVLPRGRWSAGGIHMAGGVAS